VIVSEQRIRQESFFWVIPGKLAGRAGPVVAPWDFEELKASGFTTIVSTDEECHARLIADEGCFTHLEEIMPRDYPTTPLLIDRFVELTRRAAVNVLAELKKGATVLVHCYAGRDRTGLTLCAVMMEHEGISADEALKKLRAVRPTALTGAGVLNVLREYELKLNSAWWRDSSSSQE
jgi:predicted protein tyrosine phosphatase